MKQKPDFFEKVIKGFLKKNLLFSEVFFWELMIGIIGFIPNNEQITKIAGVFIGVRLLTVILFKLPEYLIYLLGLIEIGDKTEQPVLEQSSQ
jgi:hypothetical protein